MSLDNETVIVPPCNLSKNAPVNFAYYVYNHSNAMGPIAIAFFLKSYLKCNTGTPPLTWFFGPWDNRVKGKPRYRRSILVLKPQNGEFELPKSTF